MKGFLLKIYSNCDDTCSIVLQSLSWSKNIIEILKTHWHNTYIIISHQLLLLLEYVELFLAQLYKISYKHILNINIFQGKCQLGVEAMRLFISSLL